MLGLSPKQTLVLVSPGLGLKQLISFSKPFVLFIFFSGVRNDPLGGYLRREGAALRPALDAFGPIS